MSAQQDQKKIFDEKYPNSKKLTNLALNRAKFVNFQIRI